jgi:hypothetical protein
MDIVRRVQDILLKPKETWPVIDTEQTSPQLLYTRYLMILAAIPAVAGFVGMAVLRLPLAWGLSSMIASYVLSLVMVYLLALVVEALAPTFDGRKDRLQALKLVVYGSTASMVGGIFYLLPPLSVLALLASLYSIYLFYTGLPVLMKCPPDKAIAYTAVVGVVSIVGGMILGMLVAAVTPGAMTGMPHGR